MPKITQNLRTGVHRANLPLPYTRNIIIKVLQVQTIKLMFSSHVKKVYRPFYLYIYLFTYNNFHTY